MDAPSEAPAGPREADDPEARAAFDRAERAVFDANMRTTASMVAAIAATWSVAFAHVFPQTAEITGVSFARVVALVLVADASMLAAWLAFRTRGHASAAYRVSDLAETATIQLVLGLLITPAGDALSPLWLFYVGHVLIVSSAPGNDRWHAAAVLVTPVWVALVSIVGHGSTTAAVGAVCALAVAWLVLVIVGGSRRRLSDLAFERTQLERHISGLRVEAERGRIARELHDGLTADLTAIAWRAAVLAKAPPDHGATEFGAIARRARAAIDDTRAMVWALRDDQVPWDVLLAHVRSGRCAPCRWCSRVATAIRRA